MIGSPRRRLNSHSGNGDRPLAEAAPFLHADSFRGLPQCTLRERYRRWLRACSGVASSTRSAHSSRPTRPTRGMPVLPAKRTAKRRRRESARGRFVRLPAYPAATIVWLRRRRATEQNHGVRAVRVGRPELRVELAPELFERVPEHHGDGIAAHITSASARPAPLAIPGRPPHRRRRSGVGAVAPEDHRKIGRDSGRPE